MPEASHGLTEKVERLEQLVVGNGHDGLAPTVALLKAKMFSDPHAGEDGLLLRVRAVELDTRELREQLRELQNTLPHLITTTVSETLRESREKESAKREQDFERFAKRLRLLLGIGVFALGVTQFLAGAVDLATILRLLQGLSGG